MYPPTGSNHQISLTQITNDQKKRNTLIAKILMYSIERVWTAVFTLHSGHVENVSRSRYTVNHQSQFLQGPIHVPMHGKYIYSP